MKIVIFWVGLVLGLIGPVSMAAVPPSLELELFAGVRLKGTLGTVHVIEYQSDPSTTNGWTGLVFLQPPTTNYLWVDTTTPVVGNRLYRARSYSATSNLIFLPAASFLMGSSTNDLTRSTNEGPQTLVTLSHGYWMGRFEVTQREFLEVFGTNPSSFTNSLELPVESVAWPEAANFCARLTQRELEAGRIPAGSRFRLPTEAEWEYAARAGTSTRFSYGDDPSQTGLTNRVWCNETTGLQTHEVGQTLPNPWGFYDMAGNVWEWTQDWFAPYLGGLALDPRGPPASFDFLSTFKVMRGGAFDYPGMSCRSSARGIFGANEFLRDYDLGFRVVLVIDPP